MKLLNHYLRAVRMYLPMPKGQQDDIINELSENLRSQMEEREAELGRPLSELEQEAMLLEHGNPMIVAGRYGGNQRSVSFGRQLIGPELFPLYIRVLLLNWAISIVVHPLIVFFSTRPMGIQPFLTSVIGQFVVVTFIFIVIDAVQRKSRQRWSFPPPYLQPIPRWQSVAGVLYFTLIGAWWAIAPYYTALILGPVAAEVTLAPAWHTFYWPVLLLMLTGLVQRSLTLARPQWNWLQSVTRTVINVLGLVMLPFMLSGYPFVLVASTASDPARAARIALGLNTTIWWNVAISLSIYLLVTAGFNAWLSLCHLRYEIRRRRTGGSVGVIRPA
ncbi:MAG TPA: hypothetical protein VI485_29885 [Vicinamibacterales bacterium]|nr:hypothetical protein [Vicinamibacterales bacterium]